MALVAWAEKTVASEIPDGEMSSLVVVLSGIAILMCSTAWQLAWLVVLGAALGFRRHGRRIAASLGPPRVPHGPEGA